MTHLHGLGDYEALREQHRRLRAVAEQVCNDARQGDLDDGIVSVTLLRRLKRELDGDPHPSVFATMSPT